MPSAHVPGFSHDIFISYSTRDNLVETVPVAGQKGLVSTLAVLLGRRLTRLLGTHSIWLDEGRIDGESNLKDGIEQALRDTAIMIAILSPGYHASKWCELERTRFLESVGPSDGGRARVFVIEFDKIDDDTRPPEFSTLFAYRFWVQDPVTDAFPHLLDPYNPAHSADYNGKVDALAGALAKALGAMKREAERPPAVQIPADLDDKVLATVDETVRPKPRKQRPTVYLAQPTDDLYETWCKVKGYLDQKGIPVVPGEYLRSDWAGFKEDVVTALQRARLFVQLLSTVPGRRMRDPFNEFDTTFAIAQYDFVDKNKNPAATWSILQWRDLRLTAEQISEVSDSAHRELLREGSCVQAVPMEEFKQNIVREVERLEQKDEKDKARDKRRQDKCIFVVAHRKDRDVATRVTDRIRERGFSCELPRAVLSDTYISPRDHRDELEMSLEVADGTLVVYGGTAPLWVKSQYIQIEKSQDQRIFPTEKGALLAPPTPKENEAWIKKVVRHVIKCDPDVDEDALERFLDAVNAPPSGGLASPTDDSPRKPKLAMGETR